MVLLISSSKSRWSMLVSVVCLLHDSQLQCVTRGLSSSKTRSSSRSSFGSTLFLPTKLVARNAEKENVSIVVLLEPVDRHIADARSDLMAPLRSRISHSGSSPSRLCRSSSLKVGPLVHTITLDSSTARSLSLSFTHNPIKFGFHRMCYK